MSQRGSTVFVEALAARGGPVRIVYVFTGTRAAAENFDDWLQRYFSRDSRRLELRAQRLFGGRATGTNVAPHAASEGDAMRDASGLTGLIGLIVLLYALGAVWIQWIMKSVALAFASLLSF
jgi:hypothetical protein